MSAHALMRVRAVGSWLGPGEGSVSLSFSPSLPPRGSSEQPSTPASPDSLTCASCVQLVTLEFRMDSTYRTLSHSSSWIRGGVGPLSVFGLLPVPHQAHPPLHLPCMCLEASPSTGNLLVKWIQAMNIEVEIQIHNKPALKPVPKSVTLSH